MNDTNELTAKEITKLISKSNKSQDFDALNEIIDGKINQMKEANTICSFDMEFDNRDSNNVVEIGFSVYNKSTKETFSKHYLIEEQVGQYKRNNTPMEHTLMYAHGKTETVPHNHAMRVLNNAMNNSDVSIIYAQEHKHEHMIKNNFQDDSFICIQDLMRMNSRNGSKLALSYAVEEFCDVEQPIKNAGNDAATALEITSKIFGDQINLENYKTPVVTDYSNHPKKASAAEIREARNSNPNPMPDKYTKEDVKQEAVRISKLKL